MNAEGSQDPRVPDAVADGVTRPSPSPAEADFSGNVPSPAGTFEAPSAASSQGEASTPSEPVEALPQSMWKPRPGPDPWVHRRAEPRPFALLWLAYLLTASVVSIGGVGALGLIDADVYRPAVRVLLALVGVGVVVIWPLVRLSQEPPRSAMRAAAGDLIVVVAPVLMLILPQSLPWMAGWPWDVSLAIVAVVAGWAFLVAGVLAIALSTVTPSALARSGAMGAILLLALAAPFAAAVVGTLPRNPPAPSPVAADQIEPGAAALLLVVSPLTAPFELARDRAWSGDVAMITPSHWWVILVVWPLGVVAWGLAAWVSSARNAGAGDTSRGVVAESRERA